MIKVNVEIDKKSWHKKIKNSKIYFNKKLKKVSKSIKFFKEKNIIFTILLTNSTTMKKLNKKFRNRGYYKLLLKIMSANNIITYV